MDATYGFRVVGSASNRRVICDFREALRLYAAADPSIQPSLPAFLSAFAYPEKFREYVARTGSTANYTGPVAVPSLHFDVDRQDLATALHDTRRLAHFLADKFGTDPVVHFSGGKGFHVQLLTGCCKTTIGGKQPHQTARKAASRLADEVGVEIDTGVYGLVQLWRAPNSKHHKTDRYKVKIDIDDLLYLTHEQVWDRAAEPIPYDVASHAPASGLVSFLHGIGLAPDPDSNKPKTLLDRSKINPLTRLLLTDPVAILPGERHKTIFSAAADMAEFSSAADLIMAVLREPGISTGLPPSEVERQIACGIKAARQQQGVAP
jgi:hypothetical protein